MSNPHQPLPTESRKSSYGMRWALFGDGAAAIRLPIVLGLLAAYYLVIADNEEAAYGARGPLLLISYGGMPTTGALIAAACMTAVGSVAVWPRWYTCYLAVLGVVVWLAAAAYMVVVFY
jgi:hypothetical protein